MTRAKSSAIRPGFTMFELAVACVLLCALASVATTTLVWRGAEQRTADARLLATLEAGNLLERLTLLEWSALTAEGLAREQLPAAASARLPAAQLSLTVDELTEPVLAKRISVEIQFTNPAGAPARPVRLTGWVYPRTKLAGP